MAIGLDNIYNIPASWIWLIIIVAVWKLIWYGFALYKTIEKKEKTWFVILFICAFVLNDLGILAIIYLLLRKKKGRR